MEAVCCFQTFVLTCKTIQLDTKKKTTLWIFTAIKTSDLIKCFFHFITYYTEILYLHNWNPHFPYFYHFSINFLIIIINVAIISCGTYGGEERCIQGFSGETLGEETTWKTQAWMGG
jgi:hypothetical protein